MFRKVFISLGSNIGNSIKHVKNAEALIETAIGKIIAKSYYYETAPWGMPDQNVFINSAILIIADDSPTELLIKTQEIQTALGRIKTEHWGPRIIDIDIIFYSDWIIKKENLQVPHPLMHSRNFVMVPLLDIDKNIMHPKLNKTIEELYLDSPDQSEVKKLPNY